MKIVVCIKQVPDTQKVQVDEHGVLIRDGIETKMNPYDLYALETAFQIRSMVKNCSISVLTMGPPAANEVLEEAFALGADEAYLMSDRRFAGADVLATSYTLSQGIRCIGSDVDLILCGKQTTDGDTAQVGPAMAEHLQIPHICWVKELVDANEQGLCVKQELMDEVATLSIPYPCLITVEKGIFTPGLPSYLKKRRAAEKKIHLLSLDHCVNQDPNAYGLSGSPTQVERIFTPEKNDHMERFVGSSEQVSEQLYQTLLSHKLLEDA